MSFRSCILILLCYIYFDGAEIKDAVIILQRHCAQIASQFMVTNARNALFCYTVNASNTFCYICMDTVTFLTDAFDTDLKPTDFTLIF